MVNTQTAIKPDYFKDFREIVAEKEPTNADEAVREEELIAEIADLGGWTYLKKYILDLNDLLDALVKNAMAEGASREEIGEKAITAEIAKSFLLRVVERVENARSALETSA